MSNRNKVSTNPNMFYVNTPLIINNNTFYSRRGQSKFYLMFTLSTRFSYLMQIR